MAGLEAAKGAEQLGDPEQERQRRARGRQPGRCALKPRQEPRAQPRRPEPAKPTSRASSTRPAGSAGAEHLARGAAGAGSDRAQLCEAHERRKVDESRRAARPAQRDDLAAPRPSAWSRTSQIPKLTAARAAAASAIRRRRRQPAQLEAAQLAPQDTTWATTMAVVACGRGDDSADAEGPVEGQRAERVGPGPPARDRRREPGPLQAEEGPGEQQEDAVGRQQEGEPEERGRDERRLSAALNSPRW